jgi:Trk K+ transport system NAD-binding subunit
MALSISFSFIISAILNKHAHHIYGKYRSILKKFQRKHRLDYDQILDLGDSQIAVIGMGAVGTGAYDQLYEKYKDKVIGIDIDVNTVKNQCNNGRKVILGDPSDADFWERINQSHQLNLVMLTLPRFNTSLAVVELLLETGFKGQIAAIAKFSDEIKMLKEAGVHTVYNTHIEAGAGFASNVIEEYSSTSIIPFTLK